VIDKTISRYRIVEKLAGQPRRAAL